MSMNRIRPILLNASLLTLSTLAALMLANLVASHMRPKPATGANYFSSRYVVLREYRPHADEWVTPADSYLTDTQNLQQKPYRVRTDANGFIIGPSDLLAPKMTQPVDIVFLGGSSTECGYVDEELRFPYRVGQLLNIGSGLTARTLNGGVSGNHSLHSLIQYLAKTAPLRPRYVVLMHNVNDLVLLSKTGSYWQAPPSRALVSSHPAVTPTPIINLAALVDPFMELGFSTKPTEKIDEWSKYRDGNHQVDQEEIEKQFQSSLTSFVNIVRAFGSRPILMTQLNRFKPDDEFIRATYEREWQPLSYESFVKLYARFNEIVRVVSNLNEVHLIDLDKSMPENNSLLYDAVHLNGEGSSMVASLIANEIRFTDGDYFIKK